MHISLLGPLAVGQGPVEVAPSAQKPRKVLALLLFNESRAVTLAALLDELWEGTPPKTALATLQTYVFQLRKSLQRVTGLALPDIADEVLRTARLGYCFAAGAAEFDLRTYRRLEADGLRAIGEGQLAVAAGSFRQALQLWRGPTLADVRPGPQLQAEVAGLERSRQTVLDYLVELELRLGRHRELLGELAALVPHHRFHEDLHAQYMVALYRSGYRIHALQVFTELRRAMVAEFGIEPSGLLQRCHRAVLASDPALDRMEIVALPTRATADLPRVPATASSF